MKCWVCIDKDEETDAHAVCSFCGRAVCQNHAAERPVILAMYLGGNETPKLVPVAGAIWCTICDPQDPIPMPELY